MAYELNIESIFGFHPATEVTAPLHDDTRTYCGELAAFFRDNLPASAEKTLAIRHLQMAMMFANSAIAQYGDKQ